MEVELLFLISCKGFNMAQKEQGNTAKKPKEKLLAYGAITLASVIFGFSFLFTKMTLEHLEVFQLLGIRFLIAALCMSLLVATRIVKVQLNFKKIGSILLISLAEPVLYFVFETFGVKLTSASESGMMIALIPFAVAILSMIILKEKIAGRQWLAILLAVAGVLLITLAKDSIGNISSITGYLLLLGAVLTAGLYNPLSRKASAQCTPFEITLIMMWAGAICFNTIGLTIAGTEGRIGHYFTDALNPGALYGLLYLSLVSSIVAFLCFNYAVSKIKSSIVATFANLTTVVSILAGVFINGEKLYWLQMAGAALVLAGIWLVTKNGNGKIKGEAGITK